MCPQDKQEMSARQLEPVGIKAALNWYKTTIHKLRAQDEAGAYRACRPARVRIADDRAPAEIPQAAYAVAQPVFFGAAERDYVCTAKSGEMSVGHFCKRATVKHYDGDHWIILSHADEIARDLIAWVEGLTSEGQGAASL
jgi:soluble epoxide hydrolase/lipid-phosphate phosphatase